MKINASAQSTFLFNPETSIVGLWPTSRQTKPRSFSRPLSLAAETQIGHKQEFICGVILILCLLFSLAAFVAQFALA